MALFSMKMPLVSIIIVIYNNREYISDCLNSVLQSSYKEKEIIVIDNGSTDGSTEILRKFQSDITLVKSKKNLGFAAANNRGFEVAKGEYVLLLNPDTEVTTGFLEPLVAVLSARPDVAACQPAVYLLNDKKKLNLSGKETHYLGFDWIKDYQSKKIPRAGLITSFSGCCVLLRKSAAEAAGYFDPLYFMYYEDSDLSWKLRLLGQSLWFEPKSKIYHEYKLFPPEHYLKAKTKMALLERNRLLNVYKNYQFKTLAIILPMLLVVELALLVFAILGGWAKEKIETYKEIYQNFEHIQQQRSLIQMKRVVDDVEIVQTFKATLGFIFAQNPVVQYFLNPILQVYWFLAVKLL